MTLEQACMITAPVEYAAMIAAQAESQNTETDGDEAEVSVAILEVV